MAPIHFVIAFLSLLPFCLGKCCPTVGPDGKYLQLQQSNNVQTFCSYGRFPGYKHCTYDSTDNRLGTEAGCGSTLDSGLAPNCLIRVEIRSVQYPNKCIQAGSAAGSQVRLENCDTGNNQRLLFHQGGTAGPIRVAGTNFCLEPDAGAKDSIVKIRTCSTDTKQQWKHASDSTIVHDSNLVLTVPGSGSQLIIDDANPISPRKEWHTYK